MSLVYERTTDIHIRSFQRYFRFKIKSKNQAAKDEQSARNLRFKRGFFKNFTLPFRKKTTQVLDPKISKLLNIVLENAYAETSNEVLLFLAPVQTGLVNLVRTMMNKVFQTPGARVPMEPVEEEPRSLIELEKVGDVDNSIDEKSVTVLSKAYTAVQTGWDLVQRGAINVCSVTKNTVGSACQTCFDIAIKPAFDYCSVCLANIGEKIKKGLACAVDFIVRGIVTPIFDGFKEMIDVLTKVIQSVVSQIAKQRIAEKTLYLYDSSLLVDA